MTNDSTPSDDLTVDELVYWAGIEIAEQVSEGDSFSDCRHEILNQTHVPEHREDDVVTFAKTELRTRGIDV